jgi:phosphatidylethanolamine-binding protein (PEBP) family uncharacterized protein
MSARVGKVQRSEHGHDLTVVVEEGDMLPADTCKGPDYSPEITIVDLEAPYLPLIFDDSTSTGWFTHVLIWNILGVEKLQMNIQKSLEGTSPAQEVPGINSIGQVGHSGFCFPKGEKHTY